MLALPATTPNEREIRLVRPAPADIMPLIEDSDTQADASQAVPAARRCEEYAYAAIDRPISVMLIDPVVAEFENRSVSGVGAV